MKKNIFFVVTFIFPGLCKDQNFLQLFRKIHLLALFRMDLRRYYKQGGVIFRYDTLGDPCKQGSMEDPCSVNEKKDMALKDFTKKVY